MCTVSHTLQIRYQSLFRSCSQKIFIMKEKTDNFYHLLTVEHMYESRKLNTSYYQLINSLLLSPTGL